MQKRTLVAIAAALITPILAAGLAAALEPTPHTGEGPFYPPDDSHPADNDLTEVEGGTGEPEGEVIEIIGRVTDTEGEPLEGARLVIWQTDAKGKYDHPREERRGRGGEKVPLDPNFQYWGQTTTDAEGSYRFRTIVPGNYGRPLHVHFKITHPGYPPLATEMQFAGDPQIEGDFVTGDLSEERHAQLIVELEDPEGGDGPRVARFPIVLAR